MTSEQIYRACLVLYPRAFRRDYGHAMLEAFRDLQRSGTRRGLRFWLFVAADMCRSAAVQHLDVVTAPERRLALQWIAACALGATACGSLGSLVTWAFSYFYHPYLEGATFVPWLYGAMLGTGLGLVQVAVLGGRVQRPVVWVLVTAVGAAAGVELAIAVADRAGAAGYAAVFGLVVAGAQWMAVRSRVRSGWWIASSAGALSVVALFSGPALSRTVAGMNALSGSPAAPSAGAPTDLALLFRGLYAPLNAAEFALGFGVMAATGFIIGAITARPVSSMVSRAR